MANIGTFTQPGENPNTGVDPIELFLRKFGGEVMRSYAENLLLVPRTRVKTLGGGAKSHTFGATGKLAAAYHLRGQDKTALLEEMEVGERLIHLDRPISVPTFVDEWEELVNHFDVRGPIADEIGQAIAEKIESNLLKLLLHGADAATGPVADQPPGNVITSATAGTSGSALVTAIEDQVEFWNTNSVPRQGRYIIVAPAQYRLLVALTSIHDRTLGNDNGSQKEGTVIRIAGVDILESNLIPTGITATGSYINTGEVNDYSSDGTNVVGVFGTSRALGMIQLKGLKVTMDRQDRYGGTFFYGSRTVGAGVLREVDCGYIQTA